jgi:hypothetical protein
MRLPRIEVGHDEMVFQGSATLSTITVESFFDPTLELDLSCSLGSGGGCAIQDSPIEPTKRVTAREKKQKCRNPRFLPISRGSLIRIGRL